MFLHHYILFLFTFLIFITFCSDVFNRITRLLTITVDFTCLDSLVLHLQLLHDGHFPGRSGVHDSDENTKKGLRQIQ